MDFKQLCKKIDLVFKNENEKLIMIEGFKKRNNFFIASGRTKEELSKRFISFKIKNSLIGMKFYITEL